MSPAPPTPEAFRKRTRSARSSRSISGGVEAARLAWSAWNYHILPEHRGRVPVTYNMNILQGFKAPVQFLRASLFVKEVIGIGAYRLTG